MRHNLDLYNDNQLEKFIRQCAGKLEIGTTVIAASISELTTLLEQYRLQQLRLIRTEETHIKKLTEAERTAAIECNTGRAPVFKFNGRVFNQRPGRSAARNSKVSSDLLKNKAR
jgi:hypothetical protein